MIEEDKPRGRYVEKLDVLIISRDYPPRIGGVASHVRDLALGLAKIRNSGKEHRHIYSCIVDVLAPDASTAKSKCANLRHVSLALTENDQFHQCVGLWTREGQVRRKPRHWDVIHCHDLQSAFLGMLLKTTFDTPIQPKLIFTIHRLPKGVRSAKTRSLNEARVSLARELQLVDKFIVPSEACKDALTRRETYAYPTEKVEVIRHGINFQGLRSESPTTILEDLSLAEDDVVVFCPARLDQNKGINTLLAAAQHVLTQLPHKKLRFVIAGGEVKDSERYYVMEVMNMRVVRDHPDVFNFGKVPSQDLTHAEVLDLFRKAHICVLPSVWENFPVALLEASVFKKPIIASNVGGIKEIVEDGRTGLLVYHNSAEDLAYAIVQLLSDKDRARMLAAAAHERAAAEFTVQRMAENHLRVYEELAGIRVARL